MLTAFLTLCVSVLQGQTLFTNQVVVNSNIYLHLKKEVLTNDVKLILTNRYDSSDHIWYSLASATSNSVTIVHPRGVPPFDLRLSDSFGREIEKTPKARSYWGNLNSIRSTYIDAKNGYYENGLMVPDEFFNIVNKGDYTLQVQMRTLVMNTNGDYVVTMTKPIRVEVVKR
jgi:hypothetical protein